MSEAQNKGGSEERLGDRIREWRDTGVYRFFKTKTPEEIVTTLVDERKVGTKVKDRLYATAEVFGGIIKTVSGLEAMIGEHEAPISVIQLQNAVGAALRQVVLLTEDYEHELDAKEKAMEGLAQKLTEEAGKRLEAIRQNREFYTQIMTDQLTGLYSRRFFFTDLPDRIKRAEKHNEHLSIILFDVNNFKRINDTYDHDGGDFMLKAISRLSQDYLPKAYVLARLGGDEFGIIVPKATESQAFDLAEELRKKVEEKEFIYTVETETEERDYAIKTTIALGVKQHDFSESADTLYRGADAAFYVAHKQGKNRTIKYSDFEQHIKSMPTETSVHKRPEPIAIRPRKNVKE